MALNDLENNPQIVWTAVFGLFGAQQLLVVIYVN